MPSSMATLTTDQASTRDLSTSSATWLVPPLTSTETVLGSLTPMMKVISSSSIFLSSTVSAYPRSEASISAILLTMLAPVDLPSLSMSDFLTRLQA